MTKAKDKDTRYAPGVIPLERYDARIEQGKIVYHAITKDGRDIVMPDCYSEMYTDDYLAVRIRKTEFPEVLDEDLEPEHYAPCFTGRTAR